MDAAKSFKIPGKWIVRGLLLCLVLWPIPASAQGEEVASPFRHYKMRELKTRYYEDYEVRPRKVRVPEVGPATAGRFMRLGYDPSEIMVRVRGRLSDSHRGIKFYEIKTCENCHPEQAENLHTVREKITCRQCHGLEPIAAINHYFSLMNPSRRHGAVCAKCHDRASESFATYVVHDPSPASPEARRKFPALYYAYWSMIILLAGTLAFFIPHAGMVALRELFWRRPEAVEEVPPEKVVEIPAEAMTQAASEGEAGPSVQPTEVSGQEKPETMTQAPTEAPQERAGETAEDSHDEHQTV